MLVNNTGPQWCVDNNVLEIKTPKRLENSETLDVIRTGIGGFREMLKEVKPLVYDAKNTLTDAKNTLNEVKPLVQELTSILK